MRNLHIVELALVHGAGSWEDFGTGIGLLIGSAAAGGVAGHIGGSILGYHLASYAGVGVVGATLSGVGLGLVGAYAGGYLLIHANEYLYSWAKSTNDL